MAIPHWCANVSSYEQISVLVLKCDVSGTSDIHFSLVSCFNVINGLILEVRGENVSSCVEVRVLQYLSTTKSGVFYRSSGRKVSQDLSNLSWSEKQDAGRFKGVQNPQL